MLKRKSKSRSHTMAEISLTPLIDTVLVLLVIFMVATPAMYNSIKVDLPKGNVAENSSNDKQNTVYIDKDEQIYFNDQPTTLKNLISLLQKSVNATGQQKVFVAADKTISYGTLIHVVDAIKYTSGVEHVVLSTEKA